MMPARLSQPRFQQPGHLLLQFVLKMFRLPVLALGGLDRLAALLELRVGSVECPVDGS